MYAYVILSLVLGLLAMDLVGGGPPPDPAATLLAVAAVTVAVLVAGLALSGYIRWRGSAVVADEQRFLRRVGLLGKAYRLLVAAAYATVLFEFRWSALAVHWAAVGRWTVPPLALTLAPLVVLLLVAWTAHFWADRRLRVLMSERAGVAMAGRHWTLPRYIEFMARQYLLVVLVPVMVLLALDDAVVLWLGPPDEQPLSAAVMLALLVGAFVASGPWVRVCWRTEPLPDGALRRGLVALAQRAGVRVGNILVWRTNLSIANGCMIGAVGPLRYIMVTDALLLSLAPEEVEAVFAHEVAHVKYRHVALYMLIGLAATCLALVAGDVAARWLSSAWAITAAMAGAVAATWGLGFGYVSRRCEQECDLYAVRATACPVGCSPPDPGLTTSAGADPAGPPTGADPAAPGPAEEGQGAAEPPAVGGAGQAPAGAVCEHRVMTFVRALRRIARLNGAAETARGWRHFSIARRCVFLLDVLGDAALAARFERRIRRLKIAVLAVSMAVGIAAAWVILSRPPSETDDTEHPAGPSDVRPQVERLLVRLVDRDEVDAVALRTPQFDRDADAVANLDDGGPACGRGGAAARHDEVAVEDPRGHAVAVHAEGERARLRPPKAGHVEELDDPLGRRRG